MRHSAAPGTHRRVPEQFAADVRYYLSLTPRQLPSRYLYDDLGSALFEAICRLPWYGVTRAEQRLLETHGRTILARVDPLSAVVELGPGSGDKLATLLGGIGADPLTVHLVDMSAAALESARRALPERRGLVVRTHQTTYEVGVVEAMREAHPGGATLALFLGSNIGNFDPPGSDELLRRIRGALTPGDFLLLGTDLVKPERDLLLAYDDPLGVTAAFNRNLLVRVNRDLGADFAVEAFAHRALWNPEASRVEMHLVSEREQRVAVPSAGLEFTFAAGEAIWTESSYKYRIGDVVAMIARAGFAAVDQWTEGSFALTLARAV